MPPPVQTVLLSLSEVCGNGVIDGPQVASTSGKTVELLFLWFDHLSYSTHLLEDVGISLVLNTRSVIQLAFLPFCSLYHIVSDFILDSCFLSLYLVRITSILYSG